METDLHSGRKQMKIWVIYTGGGGKTHKMRGTDIWKKMMMDYTANCFNFLEINNK